jgi:hypothetical protein
MTATAIAAAASTVDDIDVRPRYRQGLKPGAGWVGLASITPADNGFGYIATWNVYVVAPQDLAQAERWVADKALPLIEALAGELHVLSADPQTLVMPDSTNIPALVITGTAGYEQE